MLKMQSAGRRAFQIPVADAARGARGRRARGARRPPGRSPRLALYARLPPALRITKSRRTAGPGMLLALLAGDSRPALAQLRFTVREASSNRHGGRLAARGQGPEDAPRRALRGARGQAGSVSAVEARTSGGRRRTESAGWATSRREDEPRAQARSPRSVVLSRAGTRRFRGDRRTALGQSSCATRKASARRTLDTWPRSPTLRRLAAGTLPKAEHGRFYERKPAELARAEARGRRYSVLNIERWADAGSSCAK